MSRRPINVRLNNNKIIAISGRKTELRGLKKSEMAGREELSLSLSQPMEAQRSLTMVSYGF